MAERRPISRRSFLQRVGGGVALGGGALALTGCAGIADADPYDPIGGGYGGRGPRIPPPPRGGCSDNDRGRYADAPGQGRCEGPPPGCSDSDSGRYEDPAGQGACRGR